MGCDIHLHLELKIDGAWEHFVAPHVERWYRLFGAMAGVRDASEKPIALPKGLPSDCSKVTALIRQHDGPNGHSDSWLSFKELVALQKRLDNWRQHKTALEHGSDWLAYELEEVFHTYVAGDALTDKTSWPKGIEDIRAVFWFDN